MKLTPRDFRVDLWNFDLNNSTPLILFIFATLMLFMSSLFALSVLSWKIFAKHTNSDHIFENQKKKTFVLKESQNNLEFVKCYFYINFFGIIILNKIQNDILLFSKSSLIFFILESILPKFVFRFLMFNISVCNILKTCIYNAITFLNDENQKHLQRRKVW